VVTHDGNLRVVAPNRVPLERSQKAALEAFQSYPTLLVNGVVPPPLRQASQEVSLDHRDARLALGTLDDGRVLVALTRFDALGTSLNRVPLGLTTPEMAAVMGALGCRDAIMLDGGISAQLLLRESNGSARTWPGLRSVPLALIGRPRP
jgi:exopolysaccharide biosynthesis protein